MTRIVIIDGQERDPSRVEIIYRNVPVIDEAAEEICERLQQQQDRQE